MGQDWFSDNAPQGGDWFESNTSSAPRSADELVQQALALNPKTRGMAPKLGSQPWNKKNANGVLPAPAGKPRRTGVATDPNYSGATNTLSSGGMRTAANFAEMAQHPVDTVSGLIEGMSPTGQLINRAIDAVKKYKAGQSPVPTGSDIANEVAGQVAVNGQAVQEDAAQGNYGGIFGEGLTAALKLFLMKKAGEGLARVGGMAIRTPEQARAVQSSNLSSALERGSSPPKSTSTYEGVVDPIINETRQVAANLAKEKGINLGNLKGRSGYQFLTDVTDVLRQGHEQRYSKALEPVKNVPASKATVEASKQFTDNVLGKAELMDELLKGEHTDAQGNPTDIGANVTRVKNIRAKIESAGTLSDLNDLRVALNELADKGFSADGSRPATMAQQQLMEASNAVRNALYDEMGAHGAIPSTEIRSMQQAHGSAIEQHNMARQTARAMSSSASSSLAGPSLWQNLRGQAAPFEIAGRPKLAATATSRHFIKPTPQVEVFNTELQRAFKGARPANAAPYAPDTSSKVAQSFKQAMIRNNGGAKAGDSTIEAINVAKSDAAKGIEYHAIRGNPERPTSTRRVIGLRPEDNRLNPGERLWRKLPDGRWEQM